MRSDSVFESSNNLKVAVLNGEIDVEKYYCNLINSLLAFFDRLVKLSLEIGSKF
jgi:hypothetical protein